LRPDLTTFFPHECDHIVALKHGGETNAENLCLSCGHCNRHKGSDLTSIDPLTGEVTLIFNPRRDIWQDHFRLNGAIIEGITANGRTSVRMLRFNHDEQVAFRESLIRVGRYP
jgi:hypothetical protein